MQTNPVYDQLNNVSAEDTCTAMFRVLDRIQSLPPSVRVAGLGVLFVLMCRRYRIDETAAYRVATNLIADSDRLTMGQQLRATREYLEKEMDR